MFEFLLDECNSYSKMDLNAKGVANVDKPDTDDKWMPILHPLANVGSIKNALLQAQ